jgi:hypothetical protein
VLWETLLSWRNNTIGKNGFDYLTHESMVTKYNGSEIWIGGYGERKQVDKILGLEYNAVYFKEILQLFYAEATIAYSRLAMRVHGCRNLLMHDCPDGLPENRKARFRDGLWVKAEGVIYDRFDKTMIIRASDSPEQYDRYAAGPDFWLNITFVKIGWVGNVIYVLCDYRALNMTTQSFNEEPAAWGGNLKMGNKIHSRTYRTKLKHCGKFRRNLLHDKEADCPNMNREAS